MCAIIKAVIRPVQCAVGPFLNDTDNVLVVRAADTDSWQQPRGKQAGDTRWPIDYDAVIGIWQSVWLEPVQENYGRSIFSRYDVVSRELKVTLTLAETVSGQFGGRGVPRWCPCDSWAVGIYQS